MKKILLVTCLMASLAVNAEEKIVDCINTASKLTGIQYIYNPKDIADSITTTKDFKWSKENADVILSEALNLAGYTRVGTGDANTYKIINARDIRYHPTNRIIEASKQSSNDIPLLSDYMELRYQSKNGGRRVNEIARGLRPFMSRYGRVIDSRSGLLILVDQANNLQRLLPLIQREDIPFTRDELLEISRRPKHQPQDAGQASSPTPQKAE